jgi:tartrate dehydrogenase/decarboxylase/D-malate dehydrogenase
MLTRVTVIHKANVLTKIYGLWVERAKQVAKDYPDIELDFAIVDAATMWLVRRPEYFQVIVAPNMFGDILSDLAATTVGGLGFAPGGNINPDRTAGVSMFEPIHGSAPKYGGLNKANPIATILAGKLMLEHLGEERAAELVEQATEDVLDAGKVRTYDIGGRSTCSDMGDAIAERLLQLKPYAEDLYPRLPGGRARSRREAPPGRLGFDADAGMSGKIDAAFSCGGWISLCVSRSA